MEAMATFSETRKATAIVVGSNCNAGVLRRGGAHRTPCTFASLGSLKLGRARRYVIPGPDKSCAAKLHFLWYHLRYM